MQFVSTLERLESKREKWNSHCSDTSKNGFKSVHAYNQKESIIKRTDCNSVMRLRENQEWRKR